MEGGGGNTLGSAGFLFWFKHLRGFAVAPKTKAGKRRKVKRVMHEYKRGSLKGGRGRRGKVKSRRQAIAIAMSESGQSRRRSKRKKK